MFFKNIWNKLWNVIKMVLGEFWGTLSARQTFLSSKRLERFVFTVTVVVITWIINIHNLGKWTATDHIITLTPLLIAAGYNIVQERNDKKLDNNRPGAQRQEDEQRS